MSEFYTEISKYYKDIFPMGNLQLEFLKELLVSPPKKVLDVACGTGEYTKALHKEGYNVTGIDLDQSMVAELVSYNENIRALNLNMLDIDSLEEKFNMIYCIGNSLVHLEDDGQILVFLKKAYERLDEGGSLALQIINYDRILGQDIKSLDLIENQKKKLKFYRDYKRVDGDKKIYFDTRLEIGEKIFENREVLYPLRYSQLRILLEEAGFKNLKTYGSFKKDTYNEETSYALIMLGERG